ncbi:MAG: AtpZ/AtpI family protein [Acidobacteria bacterium]|nr:AtpZ/AtpI family protein [Acidobacteriota bacterium]
MSPEGEKGEGPGDWRRVLREAAPYLGIGTSLAFTVLLSLGAGYWIDGKLGTRPIFFLLGGAFGLFAAGYHFFKSVAGPKR